jgi:toxin ParE1/3/4
MSRITLRPKAERDLESIWSFIASDNIVAADRAVQRFHKAFIFLAAHPLAGNNREELSSGLRGFPVEGYVVFYALQSGDVEIVRILHAARDIPKQFG